MSSLAGEQLSIIEITVDRDYKSGGSIITEKLYIDVKQELKKKKKNYTHEPTRPKTRTKVLAISSQQEHPTDCLPLLLASPHLRGLF